MKKRKLEMEPEVLDEVRRLSKPNVSTNGKITQRAKIIDLTSQGECVSRVARQVGVDRRIVYTWLERFEAALPEANDFARAGELRAMRELIKKTLSDQGRPGRPPKYTLRENNEVTLLACTKPFERDPEWPLSGWTLRTMKAYLKEKGVLPEISRSTIQRILSKNRLKPHKKEMWENATDKVRDPETYLREARRAADILTGLKRLTAEGVYVLSIDEKTGIQVKVPDHPEKPMAPGSPEKREVFYHRVGTFTLIQAMVLNTGELLTPYMSFNHRTGDYIKALRVSINQLRREHPGLKGIIIMCDQYSTHMTSKVVEYINSLLPDPVADLGKDAKKGILKSVATRKAFLEDPSHWIRYANTPKHASWLNPIEVFFKTLETHLLKWDVSQSIPEKMQKIRAYVKWYNKYLAKPFNYLLSGFGEKLSEAEKASLRVQEKDKGSQDPKT